MPSSANPRPHSRDADDTHDSRYYTESEVDALIGASGATDPEIVRDTMAAALVAGVNISIVVDDAANTITIVNAITTEVIRDTIGTALVAGTNIQIVVDDTANTITFNAAHNHDAEYYTIALMDALLIAQAAATVLVLRNNVDAVIDANLVQLDIDGGLEITGAVAGQKGIRIDSTVATLTGTQTLTNKTLTSPVVNTPTGIVKGDVGLGNVDNTTDAGKPVSTAQQTALNLKANLASPTFTGTVALPSGQTLLIPTIVDFTSAQHDHGDADDGGNLPQSSVTSLTSDLALKAPLASPTFTGTVGLPANQALTTPTVSATGFTNAQHAHAAANSGGQITHTALTSIGTNTHAQIDTHLASVANPHAVTATQVGLSNANNTSDAAKPVSTAQQTALDLKANLASPTFTGTVVLPSAQALTAPTFADFTNAGHDHLDTDDGGLLTIPAVTGLQAALDMRRQFFTMRSGRKYDVMTHGLGKSGVAASISFPANTFRLTPFFASDSVTLNNIGIYVVTGIVGNIRLGIFTHDHGSYLATLVQDCGTVTTDVAGAKNISITQAITAGTTYSLGCVSDVAVSLYHVAPAFGMEHSATLNTAAAWGVAYTYAAFTSTISSVSTVSVNMQIMWVGVT